MPKGLYLTFPLYADFDFMLDEKELSFLFSN